MRTAGRRQLHGEARAVGRGAIVRLRQAWLRLLPQGVDRRAECPALLVGVAYQGHDETALSPAVAAHTTQDLVALLVQAVGLGPQLGGLAAVARGEAVDAVKGVVCAVSHVVAAVTRGRPGAAGTGATTRGAGLISPAASAAAAWMARRASMSASSIRPRTSLRVAGRTTGAGARDAGYARRPPADITATSGRKRWPLAASDAPPAWGSHSSATTTRRGTGARPRGERMGTRGAKRCAMAATSAAHGKVSAPWRIGWRSGTKSATCRRGPIPPNPC
jgi:hypothetical protein